MLQEQKQDEEEAERVLVLEKQDEEEAERLLVLEKQKQEGKKQEEEEAEPVLQEQKQKQQEVLITLDSDSDEDGEVGFSYCHTIGDTELLLTEYVAAAGKSHGITREIHLNTW